MASCLRCGKKFPKLSFKKSVTYGIVYNKCRGKICPDCGKVRKLEKFEEICTENLNSYHPCVKCKRITSHWIDKLCSNCFLERERSRGCVCFFDSDYNEKEGYHNNINYYCPLCEEVHPRESLCKECFEKEKGTYQYKQTFFKVFLPTAFVSLVIGFFLGWLFLVRLRRKKREKN